MYEKRAENIRSQPCIAIFKGAYLPNYVERIIGRKREIL
jgi:hypothetical protein